MNSREINENEEAVKLFFELEEGVSVLINNKDGYFLMKKLMLTG